MSVAYGTLWVLRVFFGSGAGEHESRYATREAAVAALAGYCLDRWEPAWGAVPAGDEALVDAYFGGEAGKHESYGPNETYRLFSV
jgi:hypothetical protein